jgi:hypothetical protein
MKFKNIGGTLIANCEHSAEFLSVCLDEVELFSADGLRTLAQNKKMWPMLTDISKHVVLVGVKHKPDIWKHIITAAWKSQVFVHGISGTLVVIPASTSKMNKKEFSELIEQMYAYGSDEGVPWSEPSLKAYAMYREAA